MTIPEGQHLRGTNPLEALQENLLFRMVLGSLSGGSLSLEGLCWDLRRASTGFAEVFHTLLPDVWGTVRVSSGQGTEQM